MIPSFAPSYCEALHGPRKSPSIDSMSSFRSAHALQNDQRDFVSRDIPMDRIKPERPEGRGWRLALCFHLALVVDPV